MRSSLLWLLGLGCAGDEPKDETRTPTETTETTEDTGTELPDTATDTGTLPEPTEDEDWQRFVDARDEFLLDLGVPILDCVEQVDTDHPAFHGCIDWHSAVHATWALHALYRLTEDPTYLEAADATLDPQSVALELERLQQGWIVGEIPYGFAWFLLLSRERESVAGALDLVPLADEVEFQLGTWIDELSAQDARQLVLSQEYGNLSWAVLQLWEQAVWNGDAAAQAHWEDYARTRLLPLDADCPLEADANGWGFFPACLHRARTLLTVLPADEAQAWLQDFLPTALVLPPRTDFPFAHQAGQNFSRSWGLWALWAATGDTQYRDLYMQHVVTHMNRPQYWAENYAYYAHWVAQFGVYGIALSYE